MLPEVEVLLHLIDELLQIEKIDTKCQKTLQTHVDAPQDAI